MTFAFHFGKEKSFFKVIYNILYSPLWPKFWLFYRILLIARWNNQKLLHNYEESVPFNNFEKWLLLCIWEEKSHFCKVTEDAFCSMIWTNFWLVNRILSILRWNNQKSLHTYEQNMSWNLFEERFSFFISQNESHFSRWSRVHFIHIYESVSDYFIIFYSSWKNEFDFTIKS
jgi:hypothetical protein